MIGQNKLDRIINYLDLFANERMHGAIVATAVSINPWAMIAISTCFQFMLIIMGTNLMDTNSALEAKITAQSEDITSLLNEIVGLKDKVKEHEDEILVLKNKDKELTDEIVGLKSDIVGLKNEDIDFENDIEGLKDDIVDLKNEDTSLNALIHDQSLTKDYFYVNDHTISLTSGGWHCLPSWTVNSDEVIDFQAHLSTYHSF